MSKSKVRPPSWEALALLAVLEAVAGAMPAERRRMMVGRLDAISTDWERPGAPIGCELASRRFLRPTLKLLRGELSG